MNPTPPATGSHRRTYQTIFPHPVSPHLEWRAVRALWGKLGYFAEEPNVNLKVTRNGQIPALPPPCTKGVAETDQLTALRHLLERAETTSPETNEKETHGLLVIGH
jgi:hypothetical protein